MNPTNTSTPWPSAIGVTAVLDDVLCSAQPPRSRPSLTYLRRKPGRGLVAVYGKASDPRSMYTVTVEESATSGQQMALNLVIPPGAGQDLDIDAVRIPPLGLTIQRFPHDEHLPDLAAAVSSSPHTQLWQALELVARRSLGGDAGGDVTLDAVDAVPLRYKPGDRCVIRYHLQLEDSSGARHQATVVGKLYRNFEQAASASELQTRLWELQGAQPWIARPLTVVDPLPLVLTEDLGDNRGHPATLVGTEVIRFGKSQPTQALDEAGAALAELHACSATSAGTRRRTGADEAIKAAKRATALIRYVPELADVTATVAGTLEAALKALPTEGLGPAHGSYKPSQLLFRSGKVFLVDFDQFCMADPALDVGYFLAYLRPPGMWYHRPGTRSWFEQAAATFLRAYDARLAERGVDATSRAGVLRRCHVYEAALLLKIAARRPNRLHSARAAEVRALLTEVSHCLAAAAEPSDSGAVSSGT
jgi:hypothetical protein